MRVARWNYCVPLFFYVLLNVRCTGEFNKDLLDKINELRKKHNAPKLDLNTPKMKTAQTLANEAAKNGELPKIPRPGENTFMLCTNVKKGLTPDEVATAWYDEVCDDNMSFERSDDKTLAFSQLVWRDSTRLGIGKSSAKSTENKDLTCNFVVALFDPPGNIIEKDAAPPTKYISYKENVKPGNNTKEYCKEKMGDSKRKKRSFHSMFGDLSMRKALRKRRSTAKNLERRSLYYRFPAKFYIDPDTGVAKAVSSPVSAAPQNIRGNAKSLLGTVNPYSRNVYGGVPYGSVPYNGMPMYDMMGSPMNYGYPFQQTASYAQMPAQTSMYPQPLSYGVAPIGMSSQLGALKKDTPGLQAWEDVALKVHNKLRKDVHQTDQLMWNTELAASAQKQAQSNADIENLTHASDMELQGVGENLAYNCKEDHTIAPVEESVNDWYREICNSNVDFPITDFNSKNVLHFCQVIWATTTEIGCGRAVKHQRMGNNSDFKCTYYCCRYSPKGGIMRRFEENVRKGVFDKRTTCENLPNIVAEAKNSPNAYSLGVISQDEEMLKRLQVEAESVHNAYRAKHNSFPMKIDPELNAKANDWAKSLAQKGNLEHSNDGEDGENIFKFCTEARTGVTADQFVKQWYDEVCKNGGYKFNQGRQYGTLHFTQVVWNQSVKLGIGVASKDLNDQKCTYVVAKYRPKGNVDGAFLDNVKKGSFDALYCKDVDGTPPEQAKPSGEEAKPPAAEAKPPAAEAKPPGAEAKPPGAEAKPPGAEAKPPGAEAKPPGAEAKPPGLEAKPPVAEAKPPGAEAKPPGTEAKPPGAEAKPPGAEAKPPGAEAKPPGLEAKPPVAEAKPPGAEAKPPGAEAKPPGAEAKPPGAEAKPPGAEAKPPGLEPRPPVAEAKPPGAEAKPPGAEAKPPGAEAKPPGAEAKPPGAEAKPPGLEPRPPVAEAKPPGAEAKPPGAEAKPPGAEAKPPGAEAKPPGAEAKPPGAEAKPPGLEPRPPVAEAKPPGAEAKPPGAEAKPPGTEGNPEDPNAPTEGKLPGDEGKLPGEEEKPFPDEQPDMEPKPPGAEAKPPGEEAKPPGAEAKPPGAEAKPPGAEAKPPGLEGKPPGAEAKPPGLEGKPPGAEAKPPGLEGKLPGAEAKPPGLEGKPPESEVSEQQQDQDEKNFQEDCLKVCNKFREIHHAKPISASRKLGDDAKVAVNQFARAGRKRTLVKPGELMQEICSPVEKVIPPENVVANWYRELCEHPRNFDMEGPQGAPDAAQLLWEETVEVGVAYATKKRPNLLCTFVVAMFYPPGNVPNKYVQNVKKGSFDKTMCGAENLIADETLEAPEEGKPPEAPQEGKPPEESKMPEEGKFPEEAKTPEEEQSHRKPLVGRVSESGPKNFGVSKSVEPKPEEINSTLAAPTPVPVTSPIQPKKESESNLTPTPPPSGIPAPTPAPDSISLPDPTEPKVPEEPKEPSEVTPPTPAEGKPPVEGKPPTEGKPPMEGKPPVEGKPPAPGGPLAEGKPPGDGQPPVEGKPPTEGKPPGEPPLPGENPTESKPPDAEGKPPEEGKPPVGSPEEEPKLPGEEPKAPGEEPKAPGEEPKAPGEEPKAPGEEPKAPGEEPKAPGEEPKAPGEEPKAPGEEPKAPGEEPKAPGEEPKPQEESPELDPVVEGLKAHNAFRSLHRTTLLKNNVELDRKAKEVAEDMADAVDINNAKKHEVTNWGLNVFHECQDQNASPDAAVLKWWSDTFCKENAFESEKLGPGTQVIWEGSKTMGMAKAVRNSNGKVCTTFVALYTPKGNVPSGFKENVKLGDFQFDAMCENVQDTLQSAKDLLETEESEAPTDPSKPPGETPGGTPGGSPTPEPGSPDQPDSATENKFAEEALQAHNIVRKIHEADPMTLDETMNKDAASYAQHIAKSGQLHHAPSSVRKGDGENLAYTCFSDDRVYSGSEPTKMWYDEVCKYSYTFADNSFKASTGHFTQAVWKGSKQLGVGFAKIKEKNMICYYTVARYRPPGNMNTAFLANVMRGTFSPAKVCNNLDSILKTPATKRSTPAHVGIPLNNSGIQRSTVMKSKKGGPLKSRGKKKALIGSTKGNGKALKRKFAARKKD